MESRFQAAHAAIVQGFDPLRIAAILLVILLVIGGALLWYFSMAVLTAPLGDPEISWAWGVFPFLAMAAAGALCFFFAYSLGHSLNHRVPEVRVQKGSKQEAPKQETTKQETTKQEASKPPRKSKEPITIESSSCVLKEVRTTKRSVSTAEGSELLVTLAVPSNARECHDTVTIDAPTFQLGKEATRPVSVTRPQEPYKARWLLDPEKPGRWTIAVETKRERVVVPVAVTTPLGFPAAWVQAGALIAGATTLIFGAVTLLRRSSRG